jgi:hypothetical protein
MLRSCTYLSLHIISYISYYYLKTGLNVQIFISADQIMAFFAQIEYLFANRYSHSETAGYPVAVRPPKPELTKDQRKKTGSRILLLVKEDTLTVKLNWRLFNIS